MPDFEDSTLWGISAFERMRQATGAGSFTRPEGPTLLPTTLLADLGRLHANPATDDVLEVMAACIRHREPALLYLKHEEVVWPVTLFPVQGLYHSPRDMATQASAGGLATLKLISEEPPGVRPPGHWLQERVADATRYRPLATLLWTVALHGPRQTLLAEIGGRAAYRLAPGRSLQQLPAPGALTPALARLRDDTVALRAMAKWPGLSVERAARLLNALYLNGGLMVTRSHPAARDEPASRRNLFGKRG